jgi:hypothetical protein
MPRNSSDESMISAAAGLVPDNKLQAVVTNNTENSTSVGTPSASAPVIEPVAPILQPNKGVIDPNIQNISKPVVNPIVVKTPLGDQVYGGTPVDQIKLSSFADVAAFAKDTIGAELKDVQDFVGLITNYKVVQEKAASVDKLQKLVDTYTDSINNLPKDVSLILSAALQGQDHMPIIQKLTQKSIIDFDKPFESHDALSLINHYTQKDFTKETFDTLDPNIQESFQDIAKLKYKADQDEYANMQTNIRSAAETRQKSFLASVDSSIAQMVANNPRMEKAAIEQVRQTMTTGLNDSLFAKDRTYLPDAAEKIAYLTFGKSIVAAQAKTIGDFVAKVRSETESKTTESLLMRSDRPIPTGGTGNISQNVLQAEVEKATSFLKTK